MTLKNLVFATIVGASLLAGCSKKSNTANTVSCNWDTCALKAPASEVDSLKRMLSARHYFALQQCSGLFYNVIDSGTGVKATACSSVDVTYVGKYGDSTGAKFDSSSIKSLPLTQVITGWTDGVPLLRAGGRILLFIPPTLGYGPSGYASVPGNAYLYFDVKLDAVH